MMKHTPLSKKNRLRVLASLISVVIFQLFCMGNPNDCTAADPQKVDPQRIVFYKELFKSEKYNIKDIQTNLGLIFRYFPKPKKDGIIGSETTHALDVFCSFFKIKSEEYYEKSFADELTAALFFYANLAKKEPDWWGKKDRKEECDFNSWINQQLNPYGIHESAKIREIEAPQRLIFFEFFKYENQYLKSWPESGIDVTTESKKAPPNRNDQWTVSYELTAENLKKLETENKILTLVEENLTDKPFANRNELKEAVKAEISKSTIEPRQIERFQRSILDEAEERTAYILTGQSLKLLELEIVDNDIAHDDIVHNEIFDLIQEFFEDIEFDSEDKLKEAVEEKLKTVNAHNKYLPLVLKRTKKVKTLKLTKKTLEELRKNNIPENLIDNLRNLQDIEYSSKELFLKALAAPKYYKYATECLKQFLEHSDELEAYKKTEGCFKEQLALKELVAYRSSIMSEAGKEHFFDKSKSIEWSGGSCGCVLDDLSGVVYGFYPFWVAGDQAENKENQILDFSVLSRIGYYALTFDENGDIYEQLPWVSKDEHFPQERKAAEKAAEFLRKARKYRTDVDLVIYQNDWKKWSRKTKEKLITNIVNLVNEELTDFFSRIKPYISFGGTSIPTAADGVTLYFENYPEDESNKDLYVEFIQELRKSLRAVREDFFLNIMLHRDAIGKGIYESKLLKQIIPEKEKEAKGYKDQDHVDHFLVFIEEPTTKTKKELRDEVEELFKGVQRRAMLRKIIPIITPAIARQEQNSQLREVDLKQLEDDLIYFEDNFGGVGLWPLPMNEGSGVNLITCAKEILPWIDQPARENPSLADDVNTYLTKYYQKEGAKPPSGYQNFVTLHRWGFRILFDLLLAVIAVYALLSAFICWFRGLFTRFFWWFMGVVLLFIWTFFSLLYFDPSWKKMAEGNLILFLVILVIAVIAILGFVKRSRQGALP